MKRYNEPDLEKVLSGDVLYMAIEKSGSEQLNQQSCDCNRLMIVMADKILSVEHQKQYDDWHEKLCLRIRKHYRDSGFDMTIGQVQKWVNMTMKYLFVADVPGTADAFYFCHVPIDSYIISAAEEQLNLERPALPWSKMDDYREYAEYEKQIRMRLGNVAPLEWEFKTWITMAVNKKESEHTSRAEREMKK